MARQSFWSRLTSAFDEEEAAPQLPAQESNAYSPVPSGQWDPHHDDHSTAYRHLTPAEGQQALYAPATSQPQEEEEGELSVDLYDTPDELIIKAIVAGVKTDDLDIAVSRDIVTIRGTRPAGKEAEEGTVLLQEVFWGTFSRTLTLPSEIDIEGAQALVKDGVLTLRLPKIDKNRQRKIKVKTV